MQKQPDGYRSGIFCESVGGTISVVFLCRFVSKNLLSYRL